MTSPIELECPEPDNFAAVALQMQETALQVEQRLYGIEQTLRDAANRYTFVQTTTAAATGFSTGGFNSISPIFVTNVITFSNWPNMFNPAILAVPGAGEYQIGVYVNAIASGAVTDNSHRIIRISQKRTPVGSGGFGQFIVDEAEATVFEANVGGGMDITVSGVFNMLLGDFVAFEFDHGNTGSTMNISSGAVYWITYLGSTETVEVF